MFTLSFPTPGCGWVRSHLSFVLRLPEPTVSQQQGYPHEDTNPRSFFLCILASLSPSKEQATCHTGVERKGWPGRVVATRLATAAASSAGVAGLPIRTWKRARSAFDRILRVGISSERDGRSSRHRRSAGSARTFRGVVAVLARHADVGHEHIGAFPCERVEGLACRRGCGHPSAVAPRPMAIASRVSSSSSTPVRSLPKRGRGLRPISLDRWRARSDRPNAAIEALSCRGSRTINPRPNGPGGSAPRRSRHAAGPGAARWPARDPAQCSGESLEDRPAGSGRTQTGGSGRRIPGPSSVTAELDAQSGVFQPHLHQPRART